MPRTLGDAFLHVSRLSYIVAVNYPIPELPMTEEGPSEVIEKIAYIGAAVFGLSVDVEELFKNVSFFANGRGTPRQTPKEG